jgi:3-hydroxyisobutyrate dehydrogenase-like beta-hydroxyacid dehydrogenase
MGLLADLSSHVPGGDVDARREAATQRGQLVDAPVLREAQTVLSGANGGRR